VAAEKGPRALEFILDDFGTVGTMVMGAAVNPTSDTGEDKGGPSMAATLAITTKPVSILP